MIFIRHLYISESLFYYDVHNGFNIRQHLHTHGTFLNVAIFSWRSVTLTEVKPSRVSADVEIIIVLSSNYNYMLQAGRDHLFFSPWIHNYWPLFPLETYNLLIRTFFCDTESIMPLLSVVTHSVTQLLSKDKKEINKWSHRKAILVLTSNRPVRFPSYLKLWKLIFSAACGLD